MNNDLPSDAAIARPAVGRADAEPAGSEAADPELPDEWAALRAAEDLALAARRQAVLGEAASSNPVEMGLPRVGLALSGGGVRSATFALGLMRGMAQSHTRHLSDADPAKRTLVTDGLLGRLDYLSTVSGGGYTGGMYGRLVGTYGLTCAQALMASGGSPVLDWLRRNGRYLTPSGSRDIGIAVVTYLRAWLAIHIEFMFACIVLGLLVMAPHLAQHSLQVLSPQGWERWYTAWWALSLAFWAALAPGLVGGYWAARDAPDPTARRLLPGWRDALFLLASAVGAWLLLRTLQSGDALDPVRNSLNWPTAGVLALVSLVLGQLAVMLWMTLSREPHALRVARLRNTLTRALRGVFLVALGLAGLGALDRLSWWLLEEIQTGNQWLWGGVGVGGVAVVVLRTLMQPLQQIASKADNRSRDWLPRLLDVAGLLGLLGLVTAWLVVMQWFVFAPTTLSGLSGLPAFMRAGLLALAWLGWVALTAGNAQMANTSSLHSFYRARLTRAYLAVGNRRRNMQAQQAGADDNRADVTRVVEGDDTRLRHYRPEREGGPIHLVNTCLNQTRDDKSGLYNADRKGAAVTATWRGFEVGPRAFIAFRPESDAGTLGRWVAVSGAAASPGAGSYTSRGLALLVYFLGVRLGHWMRAPRASVQMRWLSRLAWRAIPKPMMLTSEASATFFGGERPWWYLSDGGHFENTGVYALIKREVGFIILSDASSDARYEFGDIENLVRKARIDFGAEIDFYSHDEADSLFTLGSSELTVLSPEHMANNHSCRGVLLARIRYRERPGPRRADGSEGQPFRPEGTLLVIKPNLHDALDVDLLAYARKHESFPHESTGDQSFDEAQWESYHRLGEDFGRALHESWLAQLPGWRSPARHSIRVAARLGARADLEVNRAEPLWRRGARAAAIGTTLGVGASGTLLLSLWQVQEQLQRNRVDQQTEARALFTEVSKGLQTFNGACPEVPEHVVTQAALLLDLRGSPTMRPLEQAGLQRLASRITDECAREAGPGATCQATHRRIQGSLCTLVNRPQGEKTALSYWHPDIPPQEQARDGRLALREAARRFPVFGTWFVPGAFEAAVAGGAAIPEEGSAYGGVSGGMGGGAGGVNTVPQRPPVIAAAPPALPSSAASGAGGAVDSAALAPPRAANASLKACARATGASTLYIQIYDEASRPAATALRQALQAEAGAPLVVAPIENVVRSADLRQQRRPVPWSRPTLLLHDPASRPCAQAISRYIGAPWAASATPGSINRVRVRDLPASLQAQPGVIELWLPPQESTLAKKDGQEDVRAGRLAGTLPLAGTIARY